jgi:CubicO group peptidase (beta-lactamase class C family)
VLAAEWVTKAGGPVTVGLQPGIDDSTPGDIQPDFLYSARCVKREGRISGAAISGHDQMTRALLVLLLILGQFPVAAATRRRAVRHPSVPIPPAALVTAARQAAEAALMAGVPAVQIAVSDGGQIIYSAAFGMADQESATAATPRSVLQIGSVTKQFTAAAILRLAERGALTLDDRIEKFVPEFDPRGATITLRHLLSHTSGVRRDWFPPTAHVDLPSPVTREDQGPKWAALRFPVWQKVELQQRRLHAARLCDRIDHGQVVRRFRP